jgi:hypothetical protein
VNADQYKNLFKIKGLIGHLARRVKRAEEMLKKCVWDKEKSLEAFRQRFEKPGSMIEAEQANCYNQRKRLAKSRGMKESLVQTLAFFWHLVR